MIKNMCLTQKKMVRSPWIFSFKKPFFLVLSAALISACGSTGNKIQINTVDLPEGLDKVETLDVVTLTSSAKPDKKGHVKLDQLISTTSDEDETKDQNGMVLVASKLDDQIQLLDFFVPQVNEEPNLSFESTARSLVMINPILLGLTPDKRINIFERVSENPRFGELVDLVSNSDDLLEDRIVQLSTEIAVEYVHDSQDSTSDSGNNNAVQTIEGQEAQQKFNFDLPSKSCGDVLPKDSAQYPVNFYPVYTKYTEANLKEIKKSFCGDAYSKKREGKDGKYIQVSSFTQKEKAEAFAKMLQDRFGLGEIGEPTTVEEPRSGLLEEYIRRGARTIFGEVARAESVKPFFDYKILENTSTGFNYENDSPILNWLWRDRLKLTTSPGNLDLDGGVRIAEQLIVLPKDFVDNDSSWKDSMNWEKNIQDTVGNILVLPNDSKNYLWNGSSPISIELDQSLLTLEGDYEVLMSALSTYKSSKRASARSYNTILLVAESINALSMGLIIDGTLKSNSNKSSKNEDSILKLIENIELANDLEKNVDLCINQSSEDNPITDCMLTSENFLLVSNALGEYALEETLYHFFNESVSKAIPYLGLINDVSEGLNSGSRVVEMASYWYSETQLRKEPYMATVKAIEDKLLSSLNRKTQVEGFVNRQSPCENRERFHDLEFGSRCYIKGASEAYKEKMIAQSTHVALKNYSHDWYEILYSTSKGALELKLLGSGDNYYFHGMRGRNFKVRRHQTPTISRTLKIRCDDPNFTFWDIYISSECTSSGSYYEFDAETFSSSVDYPITLTCCGGNKHFFRPTALGAKGSMTMTSGNKFIEVQLFVSDN